ncbi:spermidine hydroxycinnamoyl transferase-like [Quercus lobata]|uniref:spermidine hydroxycinnamoyl transferase-like n=1 Tax=Quercus lobata TaxID=97700 RepID=UPI00124848CC|nr:spermidine hydroxycinnamoyl transferase-like [Quercus lobata]
MGVQVLEAYADAKLDDIGDFAPIGVVKDLVPKIDYTTPIKEWPLFLAQLTRFSYGGICVGTAISHTMVDGRSTNNFNLWAKLAQGCDLEDDEIPFLDRTVLKSSEPLMKLRFDHIAYPTKSPLVIRSLDAKEEQKKETSVASLLALFFSPSTCSLVSFNKATLVSFFCSSLLEGSQRVGSFKK